MNNSKLIQVIFLIFITLFMQGCSSTGFNIKSYKNIQSTLKKKYNLSRGDLIITYDLARIDNTNCIYSADVHKVVNNPSYSRSYLRKFSKNYKSSKILRSEANKKVKLISKLLVNLHKKHKVLTSNQYKYVRKISRSNFTKIDARKEINKLDKILAFIPAMLPIDLVRITSKYGYRRHPIKKKRKLHTGIDLAGIKKTPVYSAAHGVVVFTGRKNGYGNTIKIKHTDKVSTLYAHLSKISVKKGQLVPRGRKIGVQGRTGTATNDHLHFEVRVCGKTVNPHSFIYTECRCRGKK